MFWTDCSCWAIIAKQIPTPSCPHSLNTLQVSSYQNRRVRIKTIIMQNSLVLYQSSWILHIHALMLHHTAARMLPPHLFISHFHSSEGTSLHQNPVYRLKCFPLWVMFPCIHYSTAAALPFPLQISYMKCMLECSSFVKVLGILTNPPSCNTEHPLAKAVHKQELNQVTAVLSLFTSI